MRSAIYIAAIVIVLVVFSCSNERGGFLSRLLRGGGSAVPVTVESVVGQDRTPSTSIPASIEAAEQANVTLPEDATVDRVFVTEGTPVTVGSELAHLSEDEVNTKISRLRQDLRDAQNKLDRNTYILKNRDRMLEEERIDKAQYDSAEGDVQSAENDVQKLTQEISRLEGHLADLTVKSPMAGVVTKRLVAPGTTARAGEPIMTISKVDPAVVVFRVAAEEAASVRVGQPVKVRLLPQGGDAAGATVAAVDNRLNPEDNTFTVRAQLSNANGFYKAGMKAMVEIEAPQSQRVWLIPEEALIREPRGYFVFTVIQGVAHKVQVIPNQAVNHHVEIARGLKDDDVVVVRGQDKLAEGTVVDIWGR